MTIVESILLGTLQGIAEFLPISSSGHLKVVQYLMGLEEVPLLFDVFLHLATLVAVCLYFWRKIWDLLCVFGRMVSRRPAPKVDGLTESQCEERERNSRMYILAIVLATVVTGAIGVVNSKLIPDLPIQFVCVGFIVTGCLLVLSWLIERNRLKNDRSTGMDANLAVPSRIKSPTVVQALFIGLAQGIGTLPGISRSGSTIAGSQLCGVNRAQAGEFSFIVSIPAILGAFILEVKDLGEVSSSIGALPVFVGCLAACFIGYLSLTFLMKMIKGGKLQWFAAYLIPAGIAGLIFF